MASSIHRPERCLAAQGWSTRKSDTRTVTLRNGKTLELTRLCDEQLYGGPNEQPVLIESVSYYWFVGYNAMTASHLTRTMIDVKDRILYGHNQRWDYVTATAVFGGNGRDPQVATDRVSGVMEKFIQQMAQELKRPDGTALF